MIKTGGRLSVLNLTVLVVVGIPVIGQHADSLPEGLPGGNGTGRLQTHNEAGNHPDDRPWIRYRNEEDIHKDHHHAKRISNHDATNLVGHIR